MTVAVFTLVSGDAPLARGNYASSCASGVPCQYLDAVDLRIIVLTFNRWQSLERLLSSLNDLQLDGDLASVEIWIDRSKDDNRVDERTLASATNFRWRHERGQVRVHVQERHVGICGQWIDTWKPSDDNDRTIVLILEDDISLSPFAYRWLKAAHRFYSVDDYGDLAGITLQSEGLIVARSGGPFSPPASDGPAFIYALVGSWGFSPRPRPWRQFQRWYHEVRTNNATYEPYVKGIVMSNWFRIFGKRKGGEETMWTMWFIAFSHDHRLFTLYNNLNSLENTTTNCLAVNRREPGLHFHKKPANNTGLLLGQWKDRYVKFSHIITRYGFDTKRI